MKKKLIFMVCGLLSLVVCTNTKALAAQEGSASKTASHSFYLDGLKKEKDIKAMTEELANLAENYSFFVPSGSGIKVRQGPGVNYAEYTHRLNAGAQWQGYNGTAVWKGGVVRNAVLPGDSNCSGWQEIIYILRKWEEEDLVKASSESPAFVCKDFIKTSPVDGQNLFRFKLYQFGVRSLKSWASMYNLFFGPMTMTSSVELVDHGGKPVYTLKEGDKVGFGKWEQWTINSLQQKMIPVYLFVNDNDAVNVGLVFWKDAESLPIADDGGKENLKNYFTKK